MSKFGDWWVSARNRAEAAIEALFTALAPEAEAALVAAVKAGTAAALAKGGTAGDMWVSARDAAVQILESQGVTIGKALIEQAVTEHLATVASTPLPSATS